MIAEHVHTTAQDRAVLNLGILNFQTIMFSGNPRFFLEDRESSGAPEMMAYRFHAMRTEKKRTPENKNEKMKN